MWQGPEREAALLYHMERWRTTVVKGRWNEDTDRYEPVGDRSLNLTLTLTPNSNPNPNPSCGRSPIPLGRFTLVLKKDRLFATHKETPLNASGGVTGAKVLACAPLSLAPVFCTAAMGSV